ncbi:TPA: EAL domain-containing protein [Vibrio vulnificus]|nr:EAL domain-containing protein [Vibrio vulnificus]
MPNKHNISYKIQEMINLEGENIGYEVLIDAEGLSIIKADEIYNKSLMFPHSTQRLIRRLEQYINENEKEFYGKNLFINLERSHLCDKFLLCDIVILSRKSARKNVNIVIEITERNICGSCPEVETGINFLSKNKVLLALDDYELDKCDFRHKELEYDFYDFIKVSFSSLFNHIKELDEIITRHNLKLIIEHIETESEKKWILQHVPKTWAMQGYLDNTFPAKF